MKYIITVFLTFLLSFSAFAGVNCFSYGVTQIKLVTGWPPIMGDGNTFQPNPVTTATVYGFKNGVKQPTQNGFMVISPITKTLLLDNNNVYEWDGNFVQKNGNPYFLIMCNEIRVNAFGR